MPLRACVGERNINAFECTGAEWEQLKQTYKDVGLLMPCCQELAIPKTSKLGNYFFSHFRRRGCASVPESAEHIYVKTLLAKAAVSAGWSVFTEWSGKTPEGAEWIADVFCVRGDSKIALEVQLSYQTAQELNARQEKYTKSRVRAAWFAASSKFREDYLSSSKKIPFFRIESLEMGGEPIVNGFNTTLSEFVVGLLNGRVSWECIPWIYTIHYLNDTCWKCGRQVRQVFGTSIDVYSECAKTVPNMSTVLERLGKIITNDELKSLGLNIVGCFERLKGNALRFPYCNQCIFCGAPQSNSYVMKKLEVESAAIGCQEYISTHEERGRWRYVKQAQMNVV